MPIGKTLRKVTKSIKNKKVLLHPKGRKAQLITRASLRDDKVNKKKNMHIQKKGADLLIVGFFQDVIGAAPYDTQKTFTIEETRLFIEAFIARDDEELEQLKEERRPGRPASKRQDQLEHRIKQERHMFEAGWDVPDLSDAKNVEMLRNWKGSHSGVNIIKKITVKDVAEDEDAEEDAAEDTNMDL